MATRLRPGKRMSTPPSTTTCVAVLLQRMTFCVVRHVLAKLSLGLRSHPTRHFLFCYNVLLHWTASYVGLANANRRVSVDASQRKWGSGALPVRNKRGAQAPATKARISKHRHLLIEGRFPSKVSNHCVPESFALLTAGSKHYICFGGRAGWRGRGVKLYKIRAPPKSLCVQKTRAKKR